MFEKIKALFFRKEEPIAVRPSALYRLESSNRTYYRGASVVLSTVLLPVHVDNEVYESCIFMTNGEGEVVARYPDELSARIGHERIRKGLGLNRPKETYLYESVAK